MRGVEPIIAAVLVIAISISGILIVFNYSRPSISRLDDISLFNEGKKVMGQIDNAIQSVVQEGDGSTRVLRLSVSGGHYLLDNSSDSIVFSMDSNSNLIGNGISKTEGNLNMTGESGSILITLAYASIDFNGTASFGKGNRNVVIRNVGYDDISQKQIISVNLS